MKKNFIWAIFIGILSFLLILISPLPAQAALTWTEQTTPWSGAVDGLSIASSSDGQKLIAGGHSNRIYTSTDGGNNWTERQPAGNVNKFWNTVGSSADGSFLVAGEGSEAGRLYVSADGGNTWTESQPGGNINQQWFKTAVATNGSNRYLVAGSHRLYTSTNGGTTWTERQPAGNSLHTWTAVASDADGSNIIVGEYDGRLYTSTNSGATWTERRPAGDFNKNWQSVASDADGSNLIAAAANGNIYISTNGGTSWTQRIPGGFANQPWTSVSSDADGSTLLATQYGREYVSFDGGANWENVLQYNIDYRDTQVSADGLQFFLATREGYFFKGADVTAPLVAALSPASTSSGVSSKSNLVMTFDETVLAQDGTNNTITIKKAADNSVVETISAKDRKVTGSGSKMITINPATTLASGTEYYVVIGDRALSDISGNAYPGISDNTSWKFTTASSTKGGGPSKKN